MTFTPEDLEKVLDKSLIMFQGFLDKSEERIFKAIDDFEEKIINPHRGEFETFLEQFKAFNDEEEEMDGSEAKEEMNEEKSSA